MTCGLRQAGVEVIAGVDFDENAEATYLKNNKGSEFIRADVNRLQTKFFEKKFQIDRFDDDMIFVGCSPCQYYSIIRSSKEKSAKTRNLLLRFQRFVEYYRPGYVVIENVPGLMTNPESALNTFLPFLNAAGYNKADLGNCEYGIVNMKDYEIGQNRRRFSLIATRLDKTVSLPKKSNKTISVRDVIGDVRKFPVIEAGSVDLDKKRMHSTIGMSELNLRRIREVPADGGTRLAFKDNPELQLDCYVGRDNAFTDVYGRMFWDRPSPTITTKFLSISNGRFGHPEQDRGISLREGASLQSFPRNFVFETDSLTVASRLVGNAVPPKYAKKLGQILLGEV